LQCAATIFILRLVLVGFEQFRDKLSIFSF
jgi:hypothetical protein